MSYFDHVRCSACKAMLDPEQLATVPGQGMSCPRCRAPLSLKDLFGLKAAFDEEESPDLSLDDLVSGFDGGGGGSSRSAPSRGGSTSGALVPRGPSRSTEVAPATSALEAMRSLRKK